MFVVDLGAVAQGPFLRTGTFQPFGLDNAAGNRSEIHQGRQRIGNSLHVRCRRGLPGFAEQSCQGFAVRERIIRIIALYGINAVEVSGIPTVEPGMYGAAVNGIEQVPGGV